MIYYKTYTLETPAEWIVLIHGAGGSSSIWFRQLREYKKHFNVLLVDLRGHGKSKNNLEEYWNNPYTFKAIGNDVIEVLDHLKLPPAHFVGISLGSMVIRTIGEIAPEKIKTMILGGAVIRLNVRSKVLVYAGNLLKRLIPYMWLYKLLAWVIMPRSRHKQSRVLFINEAKKLCQKEFLRWTKLISEVNPLLRYFNEKEIPVPTLYIMGDEDYMFLGPVRKVIKHHAYSQLEVLKDCGHVVNIDQAELFNHLSIDFVKKIAAAS